MRLKKFHMPHKRGKKYIDDSETIVSGSPKRESEDEIDKKNIINQSSKLPLRLENKL